METTYNVTLSMHIVASNLDALFEDVDARLRAIIDESPNQSISVLEVRMEDVKVITVMEVDDTAVAGYDLHAQVYVEIECVGVSEGIVKDDDTQ